jgi:hypothetical protein
MASIETAHAGAGPSSIEALRDRLQEARLQAIMQAAGALGTGAQGEGDISAEAASRIGHLHLALLAVRDEIDTHAPKLGAGSEAPLP